MLINRLNRWMKNMFEKIRVKLAKLLLPYHYKICMEIGVNRAEQLGYKWKKVGE